jgi:hypothetical protein
MKWRSETFFGNAERELALSFSSRLAKFPAMPSANDFPARGRIAETNGDGVIFEPAGTTYRLYLKLANGEQSYSGPVGKPVEGLVRIRARKVWTVPSGGNFVAPIFGPPKTVQGRVKWLDEQHLVVHAGTTFLVDLPSAEAAVDLANGPIEVGALVNVTALPGAVFEPRIAAESRV